MYYYMRYEHIHQKKYQLLDSKFAIGFFWQYHWDIYESFKLHSALASFNCWILLLLIICIVNFLSSSFIFTSSEMTFIFVGYLKTTDATYHNYSQVIWFYYKCLRKWGRAYCCEHTIQTQFALLSKIKHSEKIWITGNLE